MTLLVAAKLRCAFVLMLSMVPLLAADGAWISLAPMPDPHQEVATAELGGKIYVIGGLPRTNRVQEYDPVTNSWRMVAPLPIEVDHAAAASVGGKLYVMGGNGDTGNSDRVYEYDPGQNRWNQKTSMPTARSGLAAAVIDGKIYAVGGASATGKELEIYDPATDIWALLAPMPTGRNHLAAGAIRGKLYVAGGRPNEGSELEAYDPATNTWSVKARMPTARSGHAGAVVGDKLYTFGGEGNPNSPVGIFPQVEVYDPDKNTWKSLDPMLTPRHGIGAAVIGNRIYIPAGATRLGGGSETGTNDAFVVEPETLWFAQFATGPGFDGELVLGNSNTEEAIATVEFRDQKGQPLQFNLGGTTRSQATVAVPAVGSIALATRDSSNLVRVGSVRVSAERPITGFIFFGSAVAAIEPGRPLTRFFIPVRHDAANSGGIAIANTADASVTVALILREESGKEVARREVVLPPSGQIAESLERLFPTAGIETRSFRGTISGTSSAPVVVLAVLFRGQNFATLPVQ
ncbi:MAG TPA: kelch repeat-containing protein [Acidobacteriota bacterium]|jgi:N-acetylneuraminic acid mutarotase|nr:kelch repeat-containing protein [Acidobacteriota bacterium]